jgi:hypothetical protein
MLRYAICTSPLRTGADGEGAANLGFVSTFSDDPLEEPPPDPFGAVVAEPPVELVEELAVEPLAPPDPLAPPERPAPPPEAPQPAVSDSASAPQASSADKRLVIRLATLA